MYSGGKLYRLIGDNFYNMVHDSLEDLGWFNPARKHLPVHLIPEPVDDNEVIQLNTIAISDEEIRLVTLNWVRFWLSIVCCSTSTSMLNPKLLVVIFLGISRTSLRVE